MLVDTGFPKNFEAPSMDLRLDDRDYIVAQLAALGITPSDIDYLVCTHFDQDHAGGHDAFPGAELIIQRRHYELARASSGCARTGITPACATA